jgi:hypothetical protein
MKLKSALEDLHASTLKALHGCLQRLEYLAGLQQKEGDYEHWGLARLHGDSPARRALIQAHRSQISEVLSTPIRDLMDDARESSRLAGLPPSAYIERLSNHGMDLLPPGPGPGSARHLNSVLQALLSLLKNRKPGSIRRVS